MISRLRTALLLFLLSVPALAIAADYPAPDEGDFVMRDFKFTSGETLPELRIHYRTLGKPAKDAKGVGRQRRAHHARHDRQRRAVHPPGIRRRAFRPRSAARRDEIFHRPARMTSATANRASPATGCTPNFRTTATRHGRGGVSPADRRPRRESRAARHGHLDGRHAHLAVGRDCIRISWTR